MSLSLPNLEEKIQESLKSINLDAVIEKFLEQDELVYIENAISPEVMKDLFLPYVEACKPFIHRNYIPLQKKGGSVSSFTIGKQAPGFDVLYKSQSFNKFIKDITKLGDKLQLCPDDDPHRVALYYYTEPGDHINWHYDTSFYKGNRYTILMGLCDNSSCKLVCTMYTKCSNREPVTINLTIAPGALVIFNGDKLWHCVTPLQNNEERVILTMEYVTCRDMSWVGRTANNIKDAVTYFGIGSLFGAYEGYNMGIYY